MQDRFKFRAWNKDTETMKEISQSSLDRAQIGQSAHADKVSVHLVYQPSMEVMQCTGLKHKAIIKLGKLSHILIYQKRLENIAMKN